MSSGARVLERAFALAEDGTAHSMADIRHYLAEEGFSHDQLRQLDGRVLLEQLMGKIASAKAGKFPRA